MTQKIPIIDLLNTNNDKEATATLISEACSTSGCFYIINHGVEDIEGVFEKSREFFHLPLEEKLKYESPNIIGRGYTPFATQNVAKFMGRINEPNDNLEKFSLGSIFPPPQGTDSNDPWWEKNVYPPGCQDAFEKYYRQVKELETRLLRLFTLALKVPTDYFDKFTLTAPGSMKFNFYPAKTAVKSGIPEKRMAEHTDGTSITILAMDKTSGLWVKLCNGQWTSVSFVEGALFINIGDILMQWTNDQWKSTPHYVETASNGEGLERQSIAFFGLLTPTATIKCIPSMRGPNGEQKYDDVSYQEWSTNKLKQMVNAG